METMAEAADCRFQGVVAVFAPVGFHQLPAKILTASSAVTLLSII